MAQASSSISSGSSELLAIVRESGEFKVFGWDFDVEEISAWAEKNNFPDDFVNALTELLLRIPVRSRRYCRIVDEEAQ
ncbi:hypothetical protein C0995_012416 [Termitomyces sp. Mi166|nr:hypothetical protein C0995_012416 [Termitomyces sp. Mi166\